MTKICPIPRDYLLKILYLFLFVFLLNSCEKQYYRIASRDPCYDTDEYYKKQIEILKKKIRKEPNNPGNYIQLGKTYAYLKQYEKACMYIEQALEIAPEELDTLKADASFQFWAVFYNAGFENCEHGEYYLALERFKQSLDFERESAYSIRMIAFCHKALGNMNEAVRDSISGEECASKKEM